MHGLRLWLLRLLIGKTPVVANVTVCGGVGYMNVDSALVFNNIHQQSDVTQPGVTVGANVLQVA